MSYEFACADAGCTYAARWSEPNVEELVQKVATHLKQEHNVRTISNTLANFVKSAVRQTSAARTGP
jgi:predicted small metal-binding protein